MVGTTCALGVEDRAHDLGVPVEDRAGEGVVGQAALPRELSDLRANAFEAVECRERGLVLVGHEPAVALDHVAEVLDRRAGLVVGLLLVLDRQRDGLLLVEEVCGHGVALELYVAQQARRAERGVPRSSAWSWTSRTSFGRGEHLQPGHDDEREDGGREGRSPVCKRIGTLRTKRTPPQRGALPVRFWAIACEYARGRLDPSQGGRC